MTTERTTQGWAYILAQTKKAHYFVNGRSLCEDHERPIHAGYWALGLYAPPYAQATDDRFTCARCRKKLAQEK